MGYDIGIGLCAGIDGANVVVKLDSAVVSKLIPKQPWRKSGTSLLQFKSDLCSARRPPEVGSEVYLDSAALTKNAPASLDLAGNGSSMRVDLRALLSNLDPQPAPVAAAKGRSSRW
ncbi:hypothetical protein IP90_02619 [Luteimonas cucumeris]|uniref:Uncharacterized protein n=1 Tax=Luteimonas cucumeris TaxID=985012 RepID=A0A562L044_9GAMM|nr:hypothetical protein [Luteimonas cucumeris]TWI00997.1 hypothetical protein IP90_02619 [Luteimonas cucumeris]